MLCQGLFSFLITAILLALLVGPMVPNAGNFLKLNFALQMGYLVFIKILQLPYDSGTLSF